MGETAIVGGLLADLFAVTIQVLEPQLFKHGLAFTAYLECHLGALPRQAARLSMASGKDAERDP